MASESCATKPLRIVAFHVLPFASAIVRAWVERHGHHLVLLVTTPGPSTRRNTTYRDVIAQAPPGQDVLITTNMRRLTQQVLAAKPDLIVSFTFPYRIPQEILTIPRYGAVNLHPTPLPRYRGPNPLRVIFDGSPTVGSTLHWMDDGFDTGRILSKQERAVPADATMDTVYRLWSETMAAAMEEGVAQALMGENGQRQDESDASYGAGFGEEDRWLDWNLPVAMLNHRVIALTMARESILAHIDGSVHVVTELRRDNGVSERNPAGTVLSHSGDNLTIAVADGVVRLRAVPVEQTLAAEVTSSVQPGAS